MAIGELVDLYTPATQEQRPSPGVTLSGLKQAQRGLWESDRSVWRATQPLMADLAEALKIVPVIDDRLISATTDGRKIYFDARYSAGLDVDTRRFLQAHLIWHCSLGHILPPAGADSYRWHLACDHEVNCLLLHQGFAMPDTAVLFFAKFNRPAVEVYDWLAAHPAIERECFLDRTVQQCIRSATSAAYDATFTPHTVDETLIETWQEHSQLIARDYRCSPHMPLAIDIMLTKLGMAGEC
ncbi:hypothetical protein R5M92_12760 [Halomonas sp. Bachu 37]|uniref:DUF2201 family putative metallopeptidase n=1 Tax=Halomonas kashgarensis TaxID=3084920 RepID=UPI003216DDC6